MKKTNILLLLIVAALFIQCSFRSDIYIQNLSSENVRLKIVYKIPIAKLSYYGTAKIDFMTGIINPKKYRRQKNLKTLEYHQLNDSTIVIEIPKNSTTRIITTSNQSYRSFLDYVEFDGKKFSVNDFLAISQLKGKHYIYKILAK